ncbi:hypothetical protein QJS66_22690 [Kocuria rhizophila]|nr:hypothetical protein QJS66_22690 [Kocuria rhizophila]
MVKTLSPETDYEVDEKKRTVGVLEPGIEAQDGRHRQPAPVPEHPAIGFLNNAIKAKEAVPQQQDYIVSGLIGEIVDEHTGRALAGRRYNEEVTRPSRPRRARTFKPRTRRWPSPCRTTSACTEALRHDGHRPDRGRRVHEHVRDRRGGHPSAPWHRARTSGTWLEERGRRNTRPWCATSRQRHAKGQPVLVGMASAEKNRVPLPPARQARCAPRGAQRQEPRPEAHRGPGWTQARSPWPPTWRGAAPTSCSAARRIDAVEKMAELGRTRSGRRGVRGAVARGARGLRGLPDRARRQVLEAGGLDRPAPSATSPAASQPSLRGRSSGVRATRGAPGSTCRCPTTLCAGPQPRRCRSGSW